MAPKRSRVASRKSGTTTIISSNNTTCNSNNTHNLLNNTNANGTTTAGLTALSASLVVADTNTTTTDQDSASRMNAATHRRVYGPDPPANSTTRDQFQTGSSTTTTITSSTTTGNTAAAAAAAAAAAIANRLCNIPTKLDVETNMTTTVSAAAAVATAKAQLQAAASFSAHLSMALPSLAKTNAMMEEFLAAQQQSQSQSEPLLLGCDDLQQPNTRSNNEPSEDEGCLHCHQKVKGMPRIIVLKDGDEEDDDNNDNINYNEEEEEVDDDDSELNIQVRCDECQAYICNACHWCHEYQANHEFRVCDRCDAFYCKNCDEMDQCDDCGEVVCGSCSTLLSCKFCGGGLCEECATACGRCGIVLCSRDAKFAVDCDTCRLSYCLVCLASGSKDPCVRCGHRPSKRMEQLVHLRLKSIYKAFKSSSNNNKNPGSGNNTTNNDSNADNRKSNPTNAEMASAATANARQHQHRMYSSSGADHPRQNCQPCTANNHNSNHHGHSSQNRKKSTTLQDMVGDDDEVVVNDDDDDYDDNDDENMTMMGRGVLPAKFCQDLEQNFLAEQKKADAAAEALLAELEEEEEANAKKKSKKKKKKERKQKANHTETTTEEDEKAAKNKAQHHQKDFRKEMVALDKSGDDGDEDSHGPAYVPVEESSPYDEKETAAKMDPVEKELMECVESGYVEGIEDLLFRLKGVPGKAVLRKNAKKALKRLRAEMELLTETDDADDDFEPVPETKTRATSPTKAFVSAKPTHTPPKSAHRSASIVSNSITANNKSETYVPISSTLVGWVIGKGGQRIRDMMEASGAKIWVDQEKVKGQPTRNVCLSGDKKCVDLGVQLVKDVISNAPPPPGSTSVAPTTTTATTVAVPTAAVASTSDPASKSGSQSAWDFATSKTQTMAERVKESAILETAAGSSVIASELQPLRAVSPLMDGAAYGITTEVVSCETRFVPLLIGKRGWTIKNIQDESGARVDIDQTVTPRLVKISGSKENVEKAVSMVRDVLSYPHAQLLYGSPDLEFIGTTEDSTEMVLGSLMADAVSPIKEKLLAASARLEKEPDRKATESPPIVVGDARSAISASSSLSSTPEPSMASSAKGALASQQLQAQLSSEPLVPPDPQQQQFNTSVGSLANHAPSSFIEPKIDMKNAAGLVGYASMHGSSAPMPYQGISTSDSMNEGLVHARAGMPQGSILHNPPLPSHQHSQIPSHQGLYAPETQTAGRPQINAGMISALPLQFQQQRQPSQSNYGPTGHYQRQIPARMGSSSQYSNNTEINPRGYLGTSAGRSLHTSYSNEAASAIATTPLRELMGHSMNRGHAVAARSTGYMSGGGDGLWNNGNQSHLTRANSLQSNNAVLHRSSTVRSNPSYSSRTSGYVNQEHTFTNSSTGLDLGYDAPGVVPTHQLRHHQPQSQFSLSNAGPSLTRTSVPTRSTFASPVSADDAGMLETLFGTAATAPGIGATSDGGTGSLLAGLNGLSLGGNLGVGGTSTGLWGPSLLTESWNPSGDKQPTVGALGGRDSSSLGDLLSGPLPNLSLDQSDESRFQWK